MRLHADKNDFFQRGQLADFFSEGAASAKALEEDPSRGKELDFFDACRFSLLRVDHQVVVADDRYRHSVDIQVGTLAKVGMKSVGQDFQAGDAFSLGLFLRVAGRQRDVFDLAPSDA